MKLYLTSYRIPVPGKLFELTGIAPKNTKTAIIPNAKDYYSERARAVKLRETTEYLSDFGLQVDVVDLRSFRNSDELRQVLTVYDLLWVSGGNTFCLRDEIEKSGFDKIIRKLLNGGLVYAGESAGACITGTSLKGLESADNPEFTECVYWDGLSLVPNFILPHVDNPMFAENTKIARKTHQDNADLLELTDSQALVVNDNKKEVISAT